MPEVRPFVGLLYEPSVAGPLGALTSPPYDVISPADHRRFYRISPHNVVRLILSREDPGELDPAGKYRRAGSLLRSWRDAGVLTATSEPSVFPYEFRFQFAGERRRVRGIVLEVDLEPWGGSIVPHERTLPGPIRDRLGVLRGVQANLSPVYAVLPGPRASSLLSSFLDEATRGDPRVELIDEEGTRHRLWATEAPREALDAIRDSRLMIADGHHRYTVALSHRREMRARHGPGPWDAMMMLVMDAAAERPPVLPIHRVVGGPLPAAPPGDRVRDLAEVLASLRDDRLTIGVLERADDRVEHRVATLPGTPPTVCALHEQLLDTAPGLDLRFVADAALAEESVASSEGARAFILPPTTVERVWDVIRSGGTLPQKSTYFWPKPRTGLVIRPFDS